MPRYFVDVAAGSDFVADEEGNELPDLQAGRDLAVRALSEVAAEYLVGRVDRIFVATVRDETGATAYSACLTFTDQESAAQRLGMDIKATE